MAKERNTSKDFKTFNQNSLPKSFEKFSERLSDKVYNLCNLKHKGWKYQVPSSLVVGQFVVWDFSMLMDSVKNSWDYNDPHFNRHWLDVLVRHLSNMIWNKTYAENFGVGDKKASKLADSESKKFEDMFK